MKKNKQILMVDVDNVMADFTVAVRDYLYNIGYELSPIDSIVHNLTSHVVITDTKKFEKNISFLNTIEFWSNLPLKPDVQKIFLMLCDKYDVYIATAPYEKAMGSFVKGRYQWFIKHFPYFDLNKIHITEQKWELDFDVIIDDKKETLEKCSGRVIAMDYPYNRDLTTAHERVKSWKDIGVLLL